MSELAASLGHVEGIRFRRGLLRLLTTRLVQIGTPTALPRSERSAMNAKELIEAAT